MTDRTLITDETREAMQFLASSPSRLQILEVLISEPCTESELRDRLEIPQATLNQNLDKLSEYELIAPEGGHYRPTGRGYGYANALAAYTRALAAVEDLGPLLEHVDPLLLDLGALADASIHTPEPNDPFAAYNAVEERIREADSIRGFVPSVGPVTLERLRREAALENADIEFVCERVAVATEGRRADESGSDWLTAKYFRYDGTLPFTLVLLGETVIVGGLDEAGLPRAFAVAENRAVRDWARRLYEDYRSGAEPLSRD